MTNKIANFMFPAQMSPQLAHAMAHVLANTDQECEQVCFFSLLVLHSSWVHEAPLSFEQFQENLFDNHDMAKLGKEALGVMADVQAYTKHVKTNQVTGEISVTAQHAALAWAGQMRGAKAFEMARVRSEALSQLNHILYATGFNDDSYMEQLGDLVENEGSDLENGESSAAGQTVLHQPDGTQLLFKSQSEAMQYLYGMSGKAGAPAPAKPAIVVDESKPHLQVFKQAEVATYLQRIPPVSMPGEGNGQQRRLLEQMAQDSGVRALKEVPADNPLAEMYQRFPHFTEVIDFISDNLALAACGDEGSPIRIPPVLLKGEPGTGKTYFAQELARVLGTVFVERDLSVTSEGWVISGMDSSWKGSKNGVVFDAIVNGHSANPVICLNEVDKCKNGGSHNSPISALYALLEPTSAEHFIDEFVPVAIDASRIVWVLTANDGDIPEPILTRLEIFDIKQPTPAECRIIAKSVWHSLSSHSLPKGHGFAPEFGEPFLDAMSRMSPRNMRKVLTRTASLGARQKRKQMTLENLKVAQQRYPEKSSRSIGF